MGWVKLDDGFFRNPKVLQITKDAKTLYLAALCYAGAQLTDGFIPQGAIAVLAADAGLSGAAAPKAARQLLDSGLWESRPGGYAIHDYLAYNQSADKVRANRESARERMGSVRSHRRSLAPPTTTTASTDPSPAVRANTAPRSPDVRPPDRDGDTDADAEQHPPSLDGGCGGRGAATAPLPPDHHPPDHHPGTNGADGADRRRAERTERSGRATRIPDDFAVTPDLRAWAHQRGAETGRTAADIDRLIDWETEKFRNFWRAKSRDNTKLDWDATWRTWFQKALEEHPSPRPIAPIPASPRRTVGSATSAATTASSISTSQDPKDWTGGIPLQRGGKPS